MARLHCSCFLIVEYFSCRFMYVVHTVVKQGLFTSKCSQMFTVCVVVFPSLYLLPFCCYLLFFFSVHLLSVLFNSSALPSPSSSHLYPVPLPLLSPLQCPEWWQCRLRCGWWKTTLHLCHWWKSTNSAVPRRASNMTTPFPDIMTVWLLCRPEAHRPATRYGRRSCKQICTHTHTQQTERAMQLCPVLICILGDWIVIYQQLPAAMSWSPRQHLSIL